MGKINKNKAIKPFRRQQPNTTSNKDNEKPLQLKTNNMSSSTINKGRTKKAKREMKKSTLLNKLKKSSDAKDKIQQAKRKAQRPVVGNMDPLLDALTSIVGGDELEKTPGYTKTQKSNNTTDSIPRKNKHPSEKTRNRSNQKDMELFTRVVTHPKFNQDPINAISDHVKYLIQMETGES